MITKVGVAIISKNNKILIGKRSSNVPFTGLWEFPGGKLEKNETPQQAIERELKEELNVESIVKEKFLELLWEYKNKTYNLLIYHTKINDSTLELNVHDEIKYVTIDEAYNYDLLKSNYKILDKLK